MGGPRCALGRPSHGGATKKREDITVGRRSLSLAGEFEEEFFFVVPVGNVPYMTSTIVSVGARHGPLFDYLVHLTYLPRDVHFNKASISSSEKPTCLKIRKT